MFYNISIHKKVDAFKNIDQQITSLNVLQDFMNTISETSSVDEKLKNNGESPYFEELLARIRDIRSSEKIFWRKVLDI